MVRKVCNYYEGPFHLNNAQRERRDDESGERCTGPDCVRGVSRWGKAGMKRNVDFQAGFTNTLRYLYVYDIKRIRIHTI